MMVENNPHTEQLPYAQISYWKGNTACRRDDNPDRCEVSPPHSRWPVLDFALERQRYELNKVLGLMSAAHQQGKIDNRAAVGKVLKDLIAI